MAWICSVESGGLRWRYKGTSILSPIARSIPMLKRYLSQECRLDSSQLRLYGMILPPSKEIFLAESQKLYMVDFLAKTFQLQIQKARDWRGADQDFFLKSCASSMKLPPSSYFLRTSPTLSIEDLTKFSRKFPKEGMIADGEYYPQPMLELRTSERDGGFLPTPEASMGGCPPSTIYDKNHKSQRFRTLQVYARTFPTPTALDATAGSVIGRGDKFMIQGRTLRKITKNGTSGTLGLGRYVQFFPTPKARDGKDNGKSPSESHRNSPSIAHVVGGKLNPMWVEWLMGYRIGWTELNASAMQLYRCKLKKRLKL